MTRKSRPMQLARGDDEDESSKGSRALEVRQVSKQFGGARVIDGMSFTLRPGEAAAIVGPNGAGKTTLLRCLVGSESVDAGEVLLDGELLDESSPRIRAAVACVLDDFAYFPDLSVAEHLNLLAWAHGTAVPDEVVADVLVDLALEVVGDQLPGTLSSGQRRRFALASGFVRPCKLLVLDEPEQRLDAAGREVLIRRLDQTKKSGTALVFASHDSSLVDAVADVRVEVGQ